MKGDPKVLELLNETLKNELTAVNQYWLHYRMLDNWGVARLADYERHESIDEMKHADLLVTRILFLEGLPNLQRLGKINVGQSVDEMLKLDLAVEKASVKAYNDGIEVARGLADNGTRELLEGILEGSEDYANWLEAQLELVGQVGLQNYLAQQIHE